MTGKNNSFRPGLDIAIIGMAGRFPGAKNIHQFWENLENGKESIHFFSTTELEKIGYNPDQINDPHFVKAGGVLEDIEYFDAPFFDYTPREAEKLDPQIRIFHECVWTALEEAGYAADNLNGSIGLYAGASNNPDWEFKGLEDTAGAFVNVQYLDKDHLTARISHKLNLTGPSFTVETQCSTSLVAVHLACQGLLSGECDIALAGGISIIRQFRYGYFYQEGMLFAPDGHCKTFDKKANGIVFGNGAGVVVLKRIQEAADAGDHIYAIIKGTAINNDGKQRISYSAPSPDGQTEVIRMAMRIAQTPSETISYVETHGTGTSLGDPIEIKGLTAAFNTDKKGFCRIGSVKTNVGHLDNAAGITSLIKTVLALKYKLIPPSLHFNTPNPKIDFENTPFVVNRELTGWGKKNYPLRAGVSSFGIGGTNAHVVLEEWPDDRGQRTGDRRQKTVDRKQGTNEKEYRLFLLSAKTETALDKMTENLAKYFKKHLLNQNNQKNPTNPGPTLSDAAYTLQVGREAFNHRRMLVCNDIQEAIAALKPGKPQPGQGQQFSIKDKTLERSIVFMFAGLGAQYVNMGRELYETLPYFRQEMDRCFEILKQLTDYPIKEILYPRPGCRGGSPCPPQSPARDSLGSPCPARDSLGSPYPANAPGQGHGLNRSNRSNTSYNTHKSYIHQTQITQPIVFIFEYALARLLIQWGIKPDAMIGYSFGEYTAACIAGVLSLEHALKLVISRGQLIEKTPAGAMLSVPLSKQAITPFLQSTPEVSLAIDNGDSCVAAGSPQAIHTFEQHLKEKKLLSMQVPASHAPHSLLMEPISKEFQETVADLNLKLNKPRIPYISNVTGDWIEDEEVTDPAYWTAHLSQTVQFARGMSKLVEQPGRIFIEIGPGRDTSTLVSRFIPGKTNDNLDTKENKGHQGFYVLNLVPPQEQNISDVYYLLNRIGQMWLYGLPIDWNEFHPGEKHLPKRISLPTYPFDRHRYLPIQSTDMNKDKEKIDTGEKELPLEPAGFSDWFYIPSWTRHMLLSPSSRQKESGNPNLSETQKKAANRTGELSFLLFIYEHGPGPLLKERLKQVGNHVITVTPGTSFEKKTTGDYCINPRETENYYRLFKQLAAMEKETLPTRIVHLWGLTGNTAKQITGETEEFKKVQDYGFYSLLDMCKAISRSKLMPARIFVVTDGIQEVTGDEQLSPAKSTVLGAVKVIPREYPGIRCCSIDVKMPPKGSPGEQTLVVQLAAEISKDTHDTVIAYRGNFRWRQTFTPLHLEPPHPDIKKTKLREKGVYLITGGISSIGLILARYLARQVKAKLILTGCLSLPPREQWNQFRQLKTGDQQDPVARKINHIKAMEAEGAEVLVFNTEVADKDGMQKAVARAIEKFGPINGVIHAAGTLSGKSIRPIAQLEKTHCQEQFAVKVAGTKILTDLFQEEKLDFCLLFSSIATVLGGSTLAAYSAANSFMDTFVKWKNRIHPSRWISLDWDGDDNREIQEGFERLLCLDKVDQLVFSRGGHLQERLELGLDLKPLTDQKELDNQAGNLQALQTNPDLMNPYVPPKQEIEKVLVETWQDIFGYEKIGIRDDFIELGGDSLKAINMANRVYKTFNVPVPLTEFFKRPFIEDLAKYISTAETDTYQPIQPAEKKEYYPLSAAQKRLYIMYQMDPAALVHNMTFVVSLHGKIDPVRLEESCRKLIQRHQITRTSFHIVNGAPIQQVRDRVEFNIEYDSLNRPQVEVKVKELEGTRGLAPLPIESAVRNPQPGTALINSFIRPFDLSRAPVLRVAIIHNSQSNALLLLDKHHIIHDGVSFTIFLKEFLAIYAAEVLPVPKLQYKDYAQWQQSAVWKHGVKKQKKYWLNNFKEEIPTLNLPYDYDRPLLHSYEGNTRQFDLEPEQTRSLRKLGLAENATLFMVLLALFYVLLMKLSGQEDIIVGTPVAGRKHPDLHPIIGIFLNTLALKNNPSNQKTFYSFLKELKKNTLEAFGNQDYPLDELGEHVGVNREPGRNPLFDVMLVLQNQLNPTPGEISHHIVKQLTLDSYPFENKTSEFHLTLIGVEQENHLKCAFEYQTKLFKEETILRFIGYFKNIVSSVIRDPQQVLAEVQIMSPQEQQQLLIDFNDTRTDYPYEKTIAQLFEQQVETTPDHIALVATNSKSETGNSNQNPDVGVRFIKSLLSISYRELNQKANRLAHVLRQKGVKPDTIVGIMFDRSLEMIIVILGILKAGGAYLPINTDFPQKRIASILTDAKVSFLLSTTGIINHFSFTRLQTLDQVKVKTVKTSPRPPIENLNILPFPERSLVDYEKYTRYIGQGMVKNSLTLQATRGCPYNCAYCCRVWPRKYAARSAENIFSEIEFYYKMGVQRFVFIDDIFNLDIENSKRFFKQVIKSKLKIQMLFPSGLRSDLLTDDYIDMMVEAGVISFPLALETASPRLQKFINKNVDIPKLHHNMTYVMEKYPQVILELQTMLGFPTETEEEAMMTLNFIKSLDYIHFPYVHILRIYPNTHMLKLALDHGISRKAINEALTMAYHQLPDTLPFSKQFVTKYQADFLNRYFLSKKRLIKVLPFQMKVLTEDEILQKYDSYLPMEIKSFKGLLQALNIKRHELENNRCLEESQVSIPNLNQQLKRHFPIKKPLPHAIKVLLLDVSQFFSQDSHMLYDVVEQPLGLMALMTYLYKQLPNKIKGKIARSRVDFDNYDQLKRILKDFAPDVIGIRSLTYYKDFFHKTVSLIRQWGFHIPIIAGGPYATTDYQQLLADRNIDLVVLGEGEITFCQVIEEILTHQGQLPGEKILENIPGIAFRPGNQQESTAWEILAVDELSHTLAAQSVTNPFPVSNPGNLAYVIFTSGSTGKPKGTLTAQYNVNRVVKTTNYIEFSPHDRVLQLSNYAFDGSVFDIFGALLNGSALVLVGKEEMFDMDILYHLIQRQRITVFFITTALFNTLVDIGLESLARTRKVLFGGERVSVPHAARALSYLGPDRILHVYGPTETTVYATYYPLNQVEDRQITIPIGSPIANTTVYILDSSLKPAAIGISGEIYIGGDAVCRGYLNNPELTAEKFYRPDRFNRSYRSYMSYITYQSYISKSIYRTGDLGCWLPDGNIRFTGRIDRQVKVRGFRIELKEIENQLLNHQDIRETVVDSREDEKGSRYLCAYIVADKTIDNKKLKQDLSAVLPGFMIPAYFIQLHRLPLTPGGKILRSKLPDPRRRSGENYSPPPNSIEKKLVDIWSDVLGIKTEKIGKDSDFFQLGGHSLKATVLTFQIHQILNAKIPLAEIFNNPTIEGIARSVKKYAETTKYVSIDTVEKKEYYPLSSAQKRLYFLQQFDLETTSYNIPLVLPLGKDIERNKLASAIKEVIARHDSLKTSFFMLNGEPVQQIHDQVNFKIEYFDFNIDRVEVKVKVEEGEPASTLISSFIRPFDLSRAPLIRSVLIKLNSSHYAWMVDIHHIVSDGTSHTILTEDFMSLYHGEELIPLRIQYKDFACWQNHLIDSGALKKQEEYWLGLFPDAGEIPRIELPTDYKRPGVFTFAGDGYDFTLNPADAVKFKTLGSRQGGTLYMNMLAALNTLFYKYSGQEDIIIGTGTTGRTHFDLQHIVGMFINTLAMRNYPKRDKTYESFLAEVVAHSVKAFENQDLQYEDLVDRLAVKRDPSRNPLLDIVMLVQNYRKVGEGKPGPKQDDFGDIRAEILPAPDEQLPAVQYKNLTTKFDMTFAIIEHGEDVHISIEYYTSIFKQETIACLVRHLKKIIKQVVSNPGIKLQDIDILSQQEKEILLYRFNDTCKDYPGGKTIGELFEQQVQTTPDHIAVAAPWVPVKTVHESPLQQVTYHQLNQKANQLAKILQSKGVGPDIIVGILSEPSIEMIVGILGVLKSKGAYLPIDPAYPEDRIKYMLEDSNAKILLKENDFTPEAFNNRPKDTHSHLHLPPAPATSLAYVIYTSGTTGRPKGVLVQHRSGTNTVYWRKNEYKLGTDDRVLQLFSFSFDGFVTSFFTPIVSGSRVVLPGKEEGADLFRLKKTIVSHQITHFICVPSLYASLLDICNNGELKSLRKITLAGESLKPTLVKKSKQLYPQLELANEYGPTENTVVTTVYRNVTPKPTIPIGKPIANTKIFICDQNSHPVPTGVMGELYIAGKGLARGYLNNPEMTAEKFDHDLWDLQDYQDKKIKKNDHDLWNLWDYQDGYHRSYRSYTSYKSYMSYITYRSYIYKTGDLARWLPDGCIEFLGRIDFQIKIRGFRVELGEIEARLVTHHMIKDAVVTFSQKTDTEPYLCAYMVYKSAPPGTAPDRIPGVEEIRDYLSVTLPGYMIPNFFIPIDSIPLTPQGKVDRKALPDLTTEQWDHAAYAAPRDRIQEKLVKIWSAVLSRDASHASQLRSSPGIDDNFFNLGGHSLKATAITLQIHKELQVKIPLIEIFKRQTIRQLAGYIYSARENKYAGIDPVEEKEYYALSPAQKGLYVHYRMHANSIAYNMPEVFNLGGDIRPDTLEEAFKKLTRRHENLRTSFYTIDNTPVQRIHREVELEFYYHDTTTHHPFVRPFDLSRAPLMRVQVLKYQKDKYLLLVEIHHIISDGISQGILARELMQIHGGKKPSGLKIRYRDYVRWQQRLLESETIKKQETYWLKQYEGEIPVLDIPTDYPYPAPGNRTGEGRLINLAIEQKLLEKINRLLSQEAMTLFFVLLAVFYILLSKYSGQEDIIVGTGAAGRRHTDLANIIGLFIDVLAMRNYPQKNKSFNQFLKEVKQNALEMYDNEDYPYDNLLKALNRQGKPLFNTAFELLNMETPETNTNGITLVPITGTETGLETKLNTIPAHYDLVIYANETPNALQMRLVYSSELFKHSTAEKMAAHYLEILNQVIENKFIKLKDISISSPLLKLDTELLDKDPGDFNL